MIDAPLRRATGPVVASIGRHLHDRGMRPGWLTGAGWAVGVGACLAAGARLWPLALAGWLANRVFDGLDGPVARAGQPTDRGGLFDIVADFSIYGGFVLGVAVGEPSARLACVALLAAYYISGTTFLALSSLLERRRHDDGDPRALRFVGGLAEGAETIAVYVLFCVAPAHAAVIAWAFAVAVAITAGQRILTAIRLLTAPADAPRGAAGNGRAVDGRQG